MTPAVSLRGISKKYRISPGRSSRLSEVLSFGKVKRSHEFWALQDVNLKVEAGTTLGIIGRNGAGKSTLLSIISGVLQPTMGEVEVRGRLTAIFGLGAGFNPLFTGRENAMLSGLILGMEREEMLERFDAIEEFAELGEFMDQPIKTYSSGMRSRLGFAVAVNVEPDILVLDEALSAGDSAFKRKAIQRMYDLRESGTTVLFVSHSMGMVTRFCTDAVLLHKGRVLTSGAPVEVADRYQELVARSQENKGTSERDRQLDYEIEHEDEEDTPTTGDAPAAGRTTNTRWAVGGAEILGLELLDESGQPVEELSFGGRLRVRVRLRYEEAMEESILGITVHSQRAGLEVFSTDTALEGAPLGHKDAGEQTTVDFTFAVPLETGAYNVEASLREPQAEGQDVTSTQEKAASFEISQKGTTAPVRGLVRLPAKVDIHTLEGRQEGPGRPL